MEVLGIYPLKEILFFILNNYFGKLYWRLQNFYLFWNTTLRLKNFQISPLKFQLLSI